MDIKDRLKVFLSAKHITPAEFERNTGLSNGYIKNIKSSIGADKINNIVSYYTELNIDWLITGKGDMLKSSGGSLSQSIVGDNNNNIGNISNSGFMAGNIRGGNIEISNGSEKKSNNNKDIIQLKNRIKELENEINQLKTQIDIKDSCISSLNTQLQNEQKRVDSLIELLTNINKLNKD